MTKMMTHFPAETNKHTILMNKMVCFLIFISCSFFLQNTQAADMGKLEMFGESSSNREALVDWAGYGEDKLSTVVITGKLFCHDHKTSTPPHPISGASMAVFCGTSGKMKKSWATGSTNSYGEFLIDLPSHLHAIPNLEKICLVKILTLPKGTQCRHGFTGKHKSIKLASIGEGIRIYSTHNIHLMPKSLRAQKKRGGQRGNRASTV